VRNFLPRPTLVIGPAPFDTEPEPLRVTGKAAGRNIAAIAIRVELELAQFLDKFNSALSVKDDSELTIKRGCYQWMAGRFGATDVEFGNQQTLASGIKVQDGLAIQIESEQVYAFRRNQIAKELRQSRPMGNSYVRIHQHAIEQQD